MLATRREFKPVAPCTSMWVARFEGPRVAGRQSAVSPNGSTNGRQVQILSRGGSRQATTRVFTHQSRGQEQRLLRQIRFGKTLAAWPSCPSALAIGVDASWGNVGSRRR